MNQDELERIQHDKKLNESSQANSPVSAPNDAPKATPETYNLTAEFIAAKDDGGDGGSSHSSGSTRAARRFPHSLSFCSHYLITFTVVILALRTYAVIFGKAQSSVWDDL